MANKAKTGLGNSRLTAAPDPHAPGDGGRRRAGRTEERHLVEGLPRQERRPGVLPGRVHPGLNRPDAVV